MINHLFLWKERGSLLILSLTSSTDKCGAALVILAIALFSRSWFSLFRIIPQTASWYEHLRIIDTHSADIVGQRCGGKEARSCAVVLIGVLVQDDTGNDGSDGGTMRRPSGETRSLV